MQVSAYPNNYVEAVETLEAYYSNKLDEFTKIPLNTFLCKAHFSIGKDIRNDWFLWWRKDHGYKEWPVDCPAIVKWCREQMIHHADDMSNLFLWGLWNKANGKPWDWNTYQAWIDK